MQKITRQLWKCSSFHGKRYPHIVYLRLCLDCLIVLCQFPAGIENSHIALGLYAGQISTTTRVKHMHAGVTNMFPTRRWRRTSSLELPDDMNNTFWDGNPATQSFFQLETLWTPSRMIPPRYRPASAPTGGNRNNRNESPSRRTCATWKSFTNECSKLSSCDNVYPDDIPAREVRKASRVLELRLRELEGENARLRRNIVDRSSREKYECMVDIQRRNLDVIASLREAKDSAERRATNMRTRLRGLKARRKIIQMFRRSRVVHRAHLLPINNPQSY